MCAVPFVSWHNGTAWNAALQMLPVLHRPSERFAGSFAADPSGGDSGGGGGTLWLATSYGGSLRFMRYNGTSHSFASMGSLPLPDTPFTMAFNASGVAHVAFRDGGQEGRCSVLAVQPTTDAYSYLGGPGRQGRAGQGRAGQWWDAAELLGSEVGTLLIEAGWCEGGCAHLLVCAALPGWALHLKAKLEAEHSKGTPRYCPKGLHASAALCSLNMQGPPQ